MPILGANLVGQRRYMTPRECAALQSLDDINLPEHDLDAYKALGNAVNAKVVRAVAEPLLAGLLPDPLAQIRTSGRRTGKRHKELGAIA